jgi:hypothetical protein
MKLGFFIRFKKLLKYQLNENSSSGSQVAPFARTDMAKPTVAFNSFAKAGKMDLNSSE